MFTKEEKDWLLYGIKIGLVIGACLGGAIGFTFGAYTFMPGILTRSMGYVISGILVCFAFFTLVGYWARLQGISMQSLTNMRMQVKEI